MSYYKDIITLLFIMIVLLLYTDVIITCNLIGDMFLHYMIARVRYSILLLYFIIPIKILQQIKINTFIYHTPPCQVM